MISLYDAQEKSSQLLLRNIQIIILSTVPLALNRAVHRTPQYVHLLFCPVSFSHIALWSNRFLSVYGPSTVRCAPSSDHSARRRSVCRAAGGACEEKKRIYFNILI